MAAVRHAAQTMLAVLLVAPVVVVAANPSDALIGAWSGTSICTKARAACRDEKALYRITAGADARTVTMSQGKIVDGREVVMGTVAYRVDWEHQTLTSEFSGGDFHGLWSFQWKGNRMTGTLKQLPEGTVIRNIDLKKE